MTTLRDAAGSTVVTGDGRRLVLGKLIKSGGAGSVYRMRDMPAQVAKLYHPDQDLALYERKVTAMLELTPELPDLDLVGKRIVQIAWPQVLLRNAQGRFLGFLMPAVDIDSTSELECVLQERQAKRMSLPTGLGPKVTLAANLAAVIAELHRQRHYVVDLKPVNLRFYRESLYMAMLDCDGFSIQGHGERFEAPQYTPDYLAPEFHARGLTLAGEGAQDRFALAVVVFQLLNFGIHPFTGRPAHDAVPTDIPSRIAGRWYAHGVRPNTSLLPTTTSGHASMPAELRTLFDRAFENAGSTRPAADEWANVLRGYAQRAAGKLVVCKREQAHQHFAGQPCAACARVEMLAGARKAAAQAPRRPPPPRPGARAMPGRAPPPAPKPMHPAKAVSNAAYAAILAKAQAKAMAATATGAPATSAAAYVAALHMPPPTPARTRTPSVVDTIAPLAVAVVFLIGLVFSLMANDPPPKPRVDDVVRERLAEIERERGREAEELTEPVAAQSTPFPSLYHLEPTQSDVDAIVGEVVQDNVFAFDRGVVKLRLAAVDRRMAWHRTPTTGGPVPLSNDVPPAMRLQLDELAANPFDSQLAFAIGWELLGSGRRHEAERFFVQAIWADADNADAWYGYGLGQINTHFGSGAMAIADLLYGDPAKVAARRASAETEVVPSLGFDADEVAITLAKAEATANRLRPKVSPSVLRRVVPVE